MSGTIIKIKYSGSTPAPTDGDLAVGELAYSFKSGTGDRLYIGDNGVGAAQTNIIIGGKYFTDKLDHGLGTLTANSAILVDASKKIDVLNVDDITLDTNIISTSATNGHLILNPNGSGQVQVQADLAVTGGVTINGTAVLAGATTLGNINITGNTISAINPTNGDITLTPKGTGDVILSGTQTLMLPKGGNIGAVAADSGKIRYNTVDNRFEGVVSGSWTGLGGVVDLDQDTKITVEANGNDDDTIRFFVGQSNVATEKGNINSTGLNINVINEFTANAGILLSDNVNVGSSSSPANLVLSGNLTVKGATTTVESITTTVTDPVMELAADSTTTAAVNDRGINFKYGDGTTIQTGFFGMDMATKRFSFQKVLGTGDTTPDDNKFNAPWGDAQFNSLWLSGNNTVTGNSTIGGTFGVTGATTLSSTLAVTGATTLSSTLGVTGVTTLAALLNANGGINCGSGKFIVADTSGNVSTQGTLTVTGATALSSTLAVTGVTTLTALLNANGGINCDSGKFIVADTSGNVSTAGTLNVTGVVDFDSTLNVDGAVTHKSTTALGSTGQMVIDAAGVMTAGTIDCGTF